MADYDPMSILRIERCETCRRPLHGNNKTGFCPAHRELAKDRIRAKENARFRERYHADPAFRQAVLSKNARFFARNRDRVMARQKAHRRTKRSS